MKFSLLLICFSSLEAEQSLYTGKKITKFAMNCMKIFDKNYDLNTGVTFAIYGYVLYGIKSMREL